MIKMKKIGGKSFWIILSISIVTLIILTVGVIFLTRENSKEFYSAGYIISSSTTKSDKIYFKDNTVYKENVFNEYVFKDTDNNEVSTDKNNFIHYLDNSLSFMKKGVILDLDNINTSLIPYYNITDKSIIKYNNGGYYIENADKTLIFGNFLGKITDNKYIVVGKDIKVKLAGSNEAISGDYFEILFVEDGVVKIENQEGSYQTVSDGSTIYIGEKIKIDLGEKNVYLENNNKLSLNEMTIDGNENIDITPSDNKVKKDDENKENQSGEATTPGGNTGTDQSGNAPSTDNAGDNQTGGEDSTTKEPTSVVKKEVSIDLISGKTTIDSIEASFQIIDTADFIKGNLILTLVNTDTGKTVYQKTLVNTSDIQNVSISSLPSDSNYVMTISEENNTTGIQYFKKIFKTESLDISLIREYVTTNTLSYSIDFSSSDVKSLKISLYDGETQVGDTQTINNTKDNIVVFEGLTNNTTYNVVVDSVILNNLNYASVYTIKTSDITLKERPKLGEISVKVSDDGKDFTLLMDKPEDIDNSITKYIYEIYKAEDITEEGIKGDPVHSFTSDKLKDQKLKLGENNILSNIDYRFKVVVEYYDNYKYNQIETAFSNYFQVLGKPTISFELNEEETTFNTIVGTVTINDEGCTVPNTGRTCFDKANNFKIKYYGPDKVKKDINNVTFDPNTMTYNLKLGGLLEDKVYTFEVYADIDMQNGEGLQEGMYIGNFVASTKGTKALKMQNWKTNNYTFENPISVSTELISTDPEDKSVDKINSITFNLYNGNIKNSIIPEPIGTFTTEGNIKELYYNKEFTLTSTMFGIESLDKLRELSGGKLLKEYTIEVADAYDEAHKNQFTILDNTYVYKTPSILLLEDEVSTPEILVEEITNIMTKSGEYEVSYDKELDDDTIRGYKVTAVYDKDKINSVLKTVDNPIRSVEFKVYNKKGTVIDTKTLPTIGTDNNVVYFFLGNGTSNEVVDKDMRRGNSYKFSYVINIDTDNDGKADNKYPSNLPASKMYNANKEKPKFKMYIDTSTKDSITYKYLVTDIDNTLVKDPDTNNYLLYYSINEETEYTSPLNIDGNWNDITFSNLKSEDIYTISYNSSPLKDSEAIKNTLNKFYFDGYHDGKSANLSYKLEYGNFDNRLKIIVNESDFLNRVSAYHLTLTAGDQKYEKVYTDFSQSDIESCNEQKCFIVDYADISSFKGKNIKVNLTAFYDTGYIGFSQKSKISNYFTNLSLADSQNAETIGFLYQDNSNTVPGKYLYIKSNGTNVVFENSPKPIGILSSNITKNNNTWKITTNNMIDIDKNTFVPFGTITNTTDNFFPVQSGIYETKIKYINLKVLDTVSLTSDNNDFKFTSITPKVSSKVTPLINGGVFGINLSVDEETLNSDFIKTDGKYIFYVDIYKETVCEEDNEECEVTEEHIKEIKTDYESLSEVVINGLDPDTKYIYKISADMNKNGTKEKTPLFDYNKAGYVEYKNSFKTLSKNEVLKELNVTVSHQIGETTYSSRKLNITVGLKTNINFDILYEIYDINEELKYTKTIKNTDFNIKGNNISAKESEDISGKEFVFGPEYYTLKIYAVTTDLNKKLELYNDKIKQVASSIYIDVPELVNPLITVNNQEAIINKDGSTYSHSIKYKITVKDTHRVIEDGKYTIELQNSSYKNACSNTNDCIVEVDIKNNTCKFKNGQACSVLSNTNNGQVIEVSFENLKANTEYVIYASANTYRNNVSLSEEKKTGFVYARKSQFTKSDLGFSLGSVTPTAITKNKVLLTFAGASNITNYIKGIEYSINVQGKETVTSGTFGKTSSSDQDIVFTLDSDGFPYLTINIPDGKELGTNNKINITYYYLDEEGQISVLKLGDETVFDYSFKME